MSSLKQKTISGLFWSFIDNFSKLGLTFVIGIILARLLDPSDFGLIGMVTIFIGISQSLIDSGFTQALIRKKNCSQADYSTVFFFNLLVSFILYLILFICAPSISQFFDEPELTSIVRVISIGIIVNAFAIVQRAILSKEINFKLQTKISIFASLISSITAITMAYNGYGVWSLVYKTLLGFLFTCLLLWLWNKWKPSLIFSLKSFSEMFSFGYKLMLSGLIDGLYRNIYLIVIGKFFSAADLGFFIKAEQFNNLPSQNITGVIQRVSYPALTKIQDDLPRLKLAYQKIIKSTMLLSFTAMMILAASAEPLILTLIGEKWLPSVIYLQLLCFIGMQYPLHAINLNMLQVQGRSDLFLKLEIIKKILAIPVIIVGVLYGIKMMIVGMIILATVAYFLNSYYSGKNINYSSRDQLIDILPSFVLALFIGSTVYILGITIILPYYQILIIQLTVGVGLFLSIAEIFKMKDYKYLKSIFKNIKNKS